MTFIHRQDAKNAKGDFSSMEFHWNPTDADRVAQIVVDGALKVHSALGPGLLESAYQACLALKLIKRGCKVECQRPLLINFEGERIEAGYRIDMCINNAIIIENKSVEGLKPLHRAQLLTYLKLTGCTLGLLINWNVTLLKHGIKRVALNHPEKRIHF